MKLSYLSKPLLCFLTNSLFLFSVAFSQNPGGLTSSTTNGAELHATIPDYPTVGQPCPDFVLQHIAYYPKQTAALKDFRGKWLLLDFWNHACMACIANFPHANALQQELGDKVQVMMVGIQDKGREVNLLYSKYREKEKLTMPCAFDSAIARRFDILTAPYSILIDDKGIVQCITSTIHTADMKAFLAGQHPSMPKAYRMHEDAPTDQQGITFDYSKPFAVNGNGGMDSDFLFRSILTSFHPGLNHHSIPSSIGMSFADNPSGFFTAGAPLEILYFFAYFGALNWELNDADYGGYYNKIVLEIKDSSFFKYSFRDGKNLFCYAVNLPGTMVKEEQVKRIMQHDLENYFGYSTTVEIRKISCWKLVTTKDIRDKLRTKGGPPVKEGDLRVGYTARNFPWEDVFKMIRARNVYDYIFDETGISGNVDVKMGCDGCVLTDIRDVKKALAAIGIDMLPFQKEMKVLVVRDSSNK